MRLVLFGCSHTAVGTTEPLNDLHNCYGKARVGNSNDKIIDDVYEYINSDEYKSHDVLLIQYTYTNRLWFPNVLPNSEFSFHSFDSDSNIYRTNKFASKELLKFYNIYIKYFWNYDLNFKKTVMEIELLKSYLDSKNVKFLHYLYTDGGNTQEWNDLYHYDKLNELESINLNDICNKLNLLKIDGFNLIEKWAIHNNFIDDTNHINKIGNKILAEKISKIIEKKFG